MRIYKTNQEAFVPEEPAENVLPEDEKSIPDLEPYHHGIWKRCPECAEVIYNDDLEENLKVCPRCSHHFRLTARERIEITADEGTFREFAAGVVGTDPLGFPGYAEKLEDMRGATGDNEALVTGECEIGGAKCVAAVMNGYFMMGSMGAAVGEKFALAAERALKKKLPLIAFTVSGGARMQEGLVSLMQMAKTSAVLGKLDEAGLLYIVVLTDPTTGGVTASFAMLGDVTVAEPNALVGFAGRRVIEQTVKQVLPQSFQRAEFLVEKGFVDIIAHRRELKATIANIIKLHEGGAGR